LKKLILILIAITFIGCGAKVNNQAAEYWYREMAQQIARNNLELAGDRYASLASEHLASPLLAEAALMMAAAHIDNEEYLLANFYYDEYAKRFGDRKNADLIAYLKLYADYKGVKRSLRDQKLVLDTINRAEEFAKLRISSDFLPYAETIKAKLLLNNYELSQEIAGLYDRLDKPGAAAIYRKKGAFAPIEDGEYERSKTLWIRRIFE
jgi:outer membrane protein assembly factor BamD